MKRAATEDIAPPAKAARLEVDEAIGTQPSAVDDVLGRLYVDEVAAGRWALGTFRDVRARYPEPQPVYRSARVCVTINNPWGPDSKDDDTLLPIKAAEFLDLLKPSIERTRSKHDYVTVRWGRAAEWAFSEEELSYDDAAWETKGLDQWQECVADEKHGWEAYRYFLAHYEDDDRDEKTKAILDGSVSG